MATVAEMQAAVDEAVTAMDASDWSGAITGMLKAKAIRMAIPDAHAGEARVLWREIQGDDLIAELRRKQNEATAVANGGVGLSKFRYSRVGDPS